MTGRYLGLVCARGGSKGVPGKNIRLLEGKPLIAYAIETGLRIKQIERVVVSTDSEEIARIARDFGAETPFMRPARLAADNSSEWLVWRHAIEHMRDVEGRAYDGIVVLPAVAPLRTDEDVIKCIDLFSREETDIVITVTEASRSPYFNMVCENGDGLARLVIQSEAKIVRRQDVPEVYDMTTIAYVAEPNFVLKAESMFDGKVRFVEVPKERALDIDTELDFAIAEFLFRNQLKRKE